MDNRMFIAVNTYTETEFYRGTQSEIEGYLENEDLDNWEVFHLGPEVGKSVRVTLDV